MKRATCDLTTYLLIHYNIMGRVWGNFWAGGNLARRSLYGLFVGSVFLLHGDGAMLTCYRSEMIRLGM